MLKDSDPRGTVEELQKMEADLAKVPSCARRVWEDGQVVIRGCHEYKRCKLAERGKSGPVNKGLRVLKKTFDVKTIISQIALTCYHIHGFQKRIEDRGGIVQIVAAEGGSIRVRGTKLRDENVPGTGFVRIVDTVVLDEPIKAFPRPGTNGNLEEQTLAAEIIISGRARIARDRPYPPVCDAPVA